MGVASMFIASSSSIADGAVSEVKLAAQACSAAKMKKEGTATQVLTSNGAGAVPSYQAVGVTSGLALVGSYNFASNTCDITGLTGQYHYWIFLNCTGSDGNIIMHLNNDNTDSHYGTAGLTCHATSIACTRTNTGEIGQGALSTQKAGCMINVWRNPTTGYAVANVIMNEAENNANIGMGSRVWCKDNATMSEITDINFSLAGGTATGTAVVYKTAVA